MKNAVKELMVKAVARAAYKEAERNANSVCPFIHGQPKMPESVKNLKKRDA